MIIHICLSSDDNYAMHLGVTMASILVNKSAEDEFSSISLTAEFRRKIEFALRI